MNAQFAPRGGGLLNNFWAQMALLAIVVIILVVLAARYLW